MSVVNEMLKELQKDQAQHKTFDGFVPSDSEKPVSIVFWRSIAVLILLLIGYIVYNEYQRESLLIESKVVLAETETNALTETVNAKDLSFDRKSSESQTIANLDQNRTNTNELIKEETESTNIAPKAVQTENVVATNNQVNLANNADTANKPIEAKISSINPTEKPNNEGAPRDTNKTVNKTADESTFAVITRSQKNIEEQQIAKLMKEWKHRSISENHEQALLLANNFRQKENQQKLLQFIQPRNASLFKQLLALFIENNPNDIQLINRSAKQLFLEKKYQATVSELLTVRQPKWDKVSYQLAALAEQKQSNHQQAIIYFETLLSLQPNRGDISMALAISYEASMKKSQAIKTFRHALQDKQLSNIQKKFIRQRLVALQG